MCYVSKFWLNVLELIGLHLHLHVCVCVCVCVYVRVCVSVILSLDIISIRLSSRPSVSQSTQVIFQKMSNVRRGGGDGAGGPKMLNFAGRPL